MTTLTIDLPEGISAEEGRLTLATKLWEDERLSLEQAADLAGYSVGAFMEILGKRGLPVFRYSTEDLDSELRT